MECIDDLLKCDVCQARKDDVEKRDDGDLYCDECWQDLQDSKEDRIWLSEWLNANRRMMNSDWNNFLYTADICVKVVISSLLIGVFVAFSAAIYLIIVGL